MKWAGMRQDAAMAPAMVKLHWASGARGIANGMTKNIFAVFRFRALALLGVAFWLACFSAGVVALLFVPATQVAAGTALLALAGVYFVSSKLSGISSVYAVFFPFASAVIVYAMLRSMAVTLRHQGVTWRGTFYPIRQLRKHMTRGPNQPLK